MGPDTIRGSLGSPMVSSFVTCRPRLRLHSVGPPLEVGSESHSRTTGTVQETPSIGQLTWSRRVHPPSVQRSRGRRRRAFLDVIEGGRKVRYGWNPRCHL